MFPQQDQLIQMLDSIDSTQKIDEYEISNIIVEWRKENNVTIPNDEHPAFSFTENYLNNSRDTYYGPMWSTNDGTYPSIKCVTPEILDYWQQRSRESKHPIMRLRYADLVWDFSKPITNKTADIAVAYIVIDMTIDIANNRLCEHDKSAITKLKRALSIVLSINDGVRVEKLCQTIIAFEKGGEDFVLV